MEDRTVTTEALIRQLQTEDQRYLGELMKRYNPQIWPLILAKSRNYQDAEEILSSTWISVWENISGLRDVNNFDGWLWKIAYNQCQRYYNNAYHSQGERPYEDEALAWHVNRDAEMLFREEALAEDAIEAVRHLPIQPEYLQKLLYCFMFTTCR